jgi:hypothetical protein
LRTGKNGRMKKKKRNRGEGARKKKKKISDFIGFSVPMFSIT